MRICVYWTEERESEKKKNSLKSRFFFFHSPTVLEEQRKCQSYDSERAVVEQQGRVMDIWTNRY